MRIIKIIRDKETENFNYVVIKFKPFLRSASYKTCFKNKELSSTEYCDTGRSIDVRFWSVVEAFIESGEKEHTY